MKSTPTKYLKAIVFAMQKCCWFVRLTILTICKLDHHQNIEYYYGFILVPRGIPSGTTSFAPVKNILKGYDTLLPRLTWLISKEAHVRRPVSLSAFSLHFEPLQTDALATLFLTQKSKKLLHSLHIKHKMGSEYLVATQHNAHVSDGFELIMDS